MEYGEHYRGKRWGFQYYYRPKNCPIADCPSDALEVIWDDLIFYATSGDGPAGRKKMMSVCKNCHSSRHTDGFFAQGDKAVRLYNYYLWHRCLVPMEYNKQLQGDAASTMIWRIH
jgi:hypothetical protein